MSDTFDTSINTSMSTRPIPAQRRPAVRAGWHSQPPTIDPAPNVAGQRELTDFVGRGIAWPLRVDHTGVIALDGGPADLESSVRTVLLTAPGERLMRPEFGCRIHELVFEPVNPNTIGLMRHAVREALTRWEPRITVDEVDVVPDPESAGLVHLHVGYRIRTTNDRRNLVHPFYLIPQEDA
ncbi:GPW/gp25 family protein [Kineosporia sp. NBRC 101731]|uniref:GPW/gp25 family protein n=1 Tax=Kineosporia sp. NBRC 101731 TaxID=3032199 RepID=UPI0024A38D54|nr:GPW/gp25 family protein [Kineosporia sp. NBRC 101731]GLY29478.1 hypothetical protein Kisp02_28430 [Kineosporia sp. NBRC 101731]